MSTTKEFSLKTYYSRDHVLDTDEAPTVPIRVRRFTAAQLETFLLGFDRLANPPSERVFYRRSEGDEQAKTAAGLFVVSQSEVRRRRLEEMTPEQRAAHQAQRAADEQFSIQFCAEVIRDHVWLPPGVVLKLEDDDGNERRVRKGAELAEAFAGNLATLQGFVRAVFEENALSGEQKKRLRSASSSTPSSHEGSPNSGLRLVATAGGAAPPDSAPPAPATDGSPSIPSGSPETSS